MKAWHEKVVGGMRMDTILASLQPMGMSPMPEKHSASNRPDVDIPMRINREGGKSRRLPHRLPPLLLLGMGLGIQIQDTEEWSPSGHSFPPFDQIIQAWLPNQETVCQS